MKKRITSLLLALIMVISLAPSALAAPGETPPYSLKYLDGIEGSEFWDFVELDNGSDPKDTIEVYDVLQRSVTCGNDWEKIIAPFCQRFRDAGFEETSIPFDTCLYSDQVLPDKSNTFYFYTDTANSFSYIIYGEADAWAVMNEGGLVYIQCGVISSGSDTGSGSSSSEPEDETRDTSGSYSFQYLEGIEGLSYATTWNYDDYISSTGENVSQAAIDAYDAAQLWSGVGGDWERTVAPLRQRFKDAGFSEEIKQDEYGDNWYWYTNGSGNLFRIMGETEAQSVLNESGMVYVMHDYSTKWLGTQTASQPSSDSTQPTQTATPGLNNFQKSRTYAAGQFADVDASAWYAPAVQSAYELGLVNGGAAGYAPTASISVAETLVLACRIHNIYNGGTGEFTQGSPWYQVYVDYADANGIISASAFTDYTSSANRQVFALIMANALPESALPAINNITAENIPDSSSIPASFLPAVLRLYNAGILTGSDAYGSFNPASDIKRSEVATIATRMAVSSERKAFTPQEKPGYGVNPKGLTLDDFTGVWRRESDTHITEYIFNGTQYECVSYDKSGQPNEYGTGPYVYTSGTLKLVTDYTNGAGETYPYIINTHEEKSYNGKSAAYGEHIDYPDSSFSLSEVNIGAGYLVDKWGHRYDRVAASTYADTARKMMEEKVKEQQAAASANDPGTTTTTTANPDIPASIRDIVPASAPTTVLDSSATKAQIKQIYNNYMFATISMAKAQVRLAESCIKSGSRAWDNYMKYVAKGQGKSSTAMEYKTRATEENTNMMRYLREAMPYLEAIEFGAELCPDVFSRVGELASDTYNDIHHLAMSPDMSIAAIRLITVQGDLELLKTAIDNAKAAIDAM